MTGGISTLATFGNPLIWWGGLIALIATAVIGIRRRDTISWQIVCGYLAQLLPWVLVSRIVFIYHYFNCTPFLILSLVYVFLYLWNKFPELKGVMWAYLGGAAILFVMFYPVLSGQEASISYVQNWLCWFPQWYFV